MPELPEVEFARSVVHKYCAGKKIVKVNTVEDDIVYANVKHALFERLITGQTIKAVRRHGKQLWVEMEKPPHVGFHFGMTGNLVVRGKEQKFYKRGVESREVAEEWPPKFTKCDLVLDDGTEVAFINIRRLGRIRVFHQADPYNEEPLNTLGFDPLTGLPSLADFSEMVLKRHVPIKALLLDQTFSAGVGNYIADEVCYQANVHPAQYSNTLSAPQLAAVHDKLHDVIKQAVEYNANYDDFPKDWLFHYRWGKGKVGDHEHKNHEGQKIIFLEVGGRTTAVVPARQKCSTGQQAPARVPKVKRADTIDQELVGYRDLVEPPSLKRKMTFQSIPEEQEEEEKKGEEKAESVKAVGKKPAAKRAKKAAAADEASETVQKSVGRKPAAKRATKTVKVEQISAEKPTARKSRVLKANMEPKSETGNEVKPKKQTAAAKKKVAAVKSPAKTVKKEPAMTNSSASRARGKKNPVSEATTIVVKKESITAKNRVTKVKKSVTVVKTVKKVLQTKAKKKSNQ